jgi:uncharacterized membrane protein
MPVRGEAVDAREQKAAETAIRTVLEQTEPAGVWPVVGVFSLAAFYLLTTLYISSHRLLWFDEIITVHFSRLPHWTSIWPALARGSDTQTPTYFMFVRLFDKLFGYSELSARLPSVLAMTAGMLITFDCVRRLTINLYGLIAFAALGSSYLPYYGYEARAYAIFFMLAALGLWLWVHTTDGWLPAICLGLVMLLGVASHYYFGLCLVPYVLWEALGWKPWQPISRKLIAASVGAIVATVLVASPALAFSRNFSASYYDWPSWSALLDIYSRLFPTAFFLLALIMVWIALAYRQERTATLPPMQPAEAVGWLSLCIPLAGFVAAKVKTNAFPDRCFIGALPGIAVAFSCCLWRRFRNDLRVAVGVLLLLASAGIAKQVMVVRNLELADRFGLQSGTRAYLNVEPALLRDGKQYIAFSPTLLYADAQYYSKHATQLALLRAPGQDPRHPELLFSMVLDRPVQWWEFDELKKHARETALILPSPGLLDAMRQAGFKVQVRFSKPLEVVYLQ